MYKCLYSGKRVTIETSLVWYDLTTPYIGYNSAPWFYGFIIQILGWRLSLSWRKKVR